MSVCATRFVINFFVQVLLMGGEDEEESGEPSAFVKAMGVFASLNRFMRSLSN